jgi:uncharacterized protein YkwD
VGETGRGVAVVVGIAALVAVSYLVPNGLGGAGGGGERAGDERARDYPTHGCDGATLEPREDVAAARRATLCLLNAERRRRGAPPLREERALRRAALAHSRAMVEGGFFAHEGPDGSDVRDRVRAAGYRGWRGPVAENLGFGTGSEASPAATVDAWMRSPGHRRNVLDRRLREIGIGIEPRPVEERDRAGATYTTAYGR